MPEKMNLEEYFEVFAIVLFVFIGGSLVCFGLVLVTGKIIFALASGLCLVGACLIGEFMLRTRGLH